MKLPKSKLTLLLLLTVFLSACGESACGGLFQGPLAVIVTSIFPGFDDKHPLPYSQSNQAPIRIWIAEAASDTPLSLITYTPQNSTIGGVNVLPGAKARFLTSYYKDPASTSLGLYLGIGDGTVQWLSGVTGAARAALPIAPGVQDFVVSDDGKFGYATSAGDTRLFGADLSPAVWKVAWTVDLGGGSSPFGSAVMPDTSKVYVTDKSRARFYAVNPATKTFTTTTLAAEPSELGKPAITPDGTQLWIPNVTLNKVFVYDTLTDSLVTTITGFVDPREIVFSFNGESAYILSSPPSGFGQVSTFNAKTYAFSRAVRVGTQPRGLTLNPSGTSLLEANSGDGTIGLMSASADAGYVTQPVGAKPVGVSTNR